MFPGFHSLGVQSCFLLKVKLLVLTECEPEMQAYFPEKQNWWKNNQSECQTQNWQHFSSRLPHFERQKSSASSLGMNLGHKFIYTINVS